MLVFVSSLIRTGHGQILCDDATVRTPFSGVLLIFIVAKVAKVAKVVKRLNLKLSTTPGSHLINVPRRKYSCAPNRHTLEFLPAVETKKAGKSFFISTAKCYVPN